MRKMKQIFTAIAVVAVVGSSLGLSANTSNAKRASLCLYKRNGNMCPFTRFANNGLTQISQAHIRTNSGNCPSAVAATLCTRTVNVQVEP